jgi:hypothetical protein
MYTLILFQPSNRCIGITKSCVVIFTCKFHIIFTSLQYPQWMYTRKCLCVRAQVCEWMCVEPLAGVNVCMPIHIFL